MASRVTRPSWLTTVVSEVQSLIDLDISSQRKQRALVEYLTLRASAPRSNIERLILSGLIAHLDVSHSGRKQVLALFRNETIRAAGHTAGARRAEAIKRYVEMHFTGNLTVERIATDLKLPASAVPSLFQRHFGMTIGESSPRSGRCMRLDSWLIQTGKSKVWACLQALEVELRFIESFESALGYRRLLFGNDLSGCAKSYMNQMIRLGAC